MSSPSNLYAEKIFAEHPLALWALDDSADYISLIGESTRQISLWSVDGGILSNDSSISDEPFPGSYVTKLVADYPEANFGSTTMVSQDIMNFRDLNSSLATFSIGCYVYADSSYVSGYEIGYEYYDTASGENVQKLRSYSSSISNRWTFIAETFDIPSDNTTFRIVLKINYLGGSQDDLDYIFYLNGLTLGQWSEEFNSTSLGVPKITIPSRILGSNKYAIEAAQYGLIEEPGYYVVTDNALVAKNSGVPMVYGSSNVTTIYPNNGDPSVVIPGKGFLNESGKFSSYAAELWIKINSDAIEAKKIFGPLRSSDGLYVDDKSLILKIGSRHGYHYVGEWNRPMLIDIRFDSNTASLLVNGEDVINLNLSDIPLSFPDYSDETNDNDWLGFWAYEEVSPIEIDAFAIYPYIVPNIVAKRRFIYGQAVEFPENINNAYGGVSAYVDYQFADYTNNYNYPDIGSWNQGIMENVSIENGILSTPNFSLPEVFLQNRSLSQWKTSLEAAQNSQDLFIKIKPDESWSDINGYLYFDKLDILSEPTKCFYGIFRGTNETENQILFSIINKTNSNRLEIRLNGNKIQYVLRYSGTEELIYEALGYIYGDRFVVGINIESFTSFNDGNAATFFGDRSNLAVLVGGNTDLTNSFDGEIYKIGFCTERNFSKISKLFNDIGVPLDYENIFDIYNSIVSYDAGEAYFGTISSFWERLLDGGSTPFQTEENPWVPELPEMFDHTASYTLIPKQIFGSYDLDIAVDSYWEDYIPLSYFAQYVTDSRGDSYYDLDFMQFNVNYPAPSRFVQQAVESEWTYDELMAEYQVPVQKTYSLLDNHLYTGYENYIDLKNRSSKTYKFDTSTSSVKTYITFQYLEAGANALPSYFTNVQAASKNGIVAPGNEWINTKYEVVNNMIIYPPSGVDFNDVAIVVHVDMNVNGIFSNPIKIKTLQLASQSFNENSPNNIGTRFGKNIFPYRKSGVYFDYKSRNPFSIYKGSSPYLYLTRYSGIQLRGDYDPLELRGLSIPINTSMASNFKVIAAQAAIRYDEDFFPYAPTQIFEIESNNSFIKFYMVATHPDGKRAKIYGINTDTGQIENGIAFFLNGKLVKEPTITVREWAYLGIGFSNTLNFARNVGAFRITGPILVNNLSYYQSTTLQEVQTISVRPWFRVKTAGANDLEWDYWNRAAIWNGVLVLSSTSYYGVDPSDVYKTFTGTNKIIVDDTREFKITNYEYTFLNDTEWQSQVLNGA